MGATETKTCDRSQLSHVDRGAAPSPVLRAQSLNKESQGSLFFLIFLLTQVLFIRPVTVYLFFSEGGKSNRVA